ncbi:MAG TPA: hypothetical protein VK177_08315 [Flavobacteriales bacterium]|nr:hypothetical protein [Flavobacteriales bacterium]
MNLHNRSLKVDLIEFNFASETDVLLMYKRVKNLGELAGMSIYDQLRFTTAVTEMIRICCLLFGTGHSIFYIDKQCIEIELRVNIEGPIDRIKLEAEMGRSAALENHLNISQLTDAFQVDIEGTIMKIVLAKRINAQKAFFRDTINKWNTILGNIVIVSPYEEIKKSNIELLKLYEGLKRNE